jgi:hypothetical protein
VWRRRDHEHVRVTEQLHREGHVRGRDRDAIVPCEARPEVERETAMVLGDIPPFGQDPLLLLQLNATHEWEEDQELGVHIHGRIEHLRVTAVGDGQGRRGQRAPAREIGHAAGEHQCGEGHAAGDADRDAGALAPGRTRRGRREPSHGDVRWHDGGRTTRNDEERRREKASIFAGAGGCRRPLSRAPPC